MFNKIDITFEYTAPLFNIGTDLALMSALNYHPVKDIFNLKKKIALGVVKQITEANGPLVTGTYNLKADFNLLTNDGDAQFVRIA